MTDQGGSGGGRSGGGSGEARAWTWLIVLAVLWAGLTTFARTQLDVPFWATALATVVVAVLASVLWSRRGNGG